MLCLLLEGAVEDGTVEEPIAVSSSDRPGLFERAAFLRLLVLVGRKYEGSLGAIFGAMTSRQSSLIRYGSVSLILSAENVAFGRAVLDVLAFDSDLERENGGRLF